MVAVLSIVTPANSITDLFLLLIKVVASVLSAIDSIPPPIANSACVVALPLRPKTVVLFIPLAISLSVPTTRLFLDVLFIVLLSPIIISKSNYSYS